MNKKLLSLLLVLPFAGSQMHAIVDAQIALDTQTAHSEDTLVVASDDTQMMESKIQTIIQLNAKLMELEVLAQKAMENTKQLADKIPARIAAKKLQEMVRNASNEAKMLHRKLVLAVQESKNVVNDVNERMKKSLQSLLEALNTYRNDSDNLINPKENLELMK